MRLQTEGSSSPLAALWNLTANITAAPPPFGPSPEAARVQAAPFLNLLSGPGASSPPDRRLVGHRGRYSQGCLVTRSARDRSPALREL
jgi:hypothetical protein